MAVPSSYFVVQNRIPSILKAIQKAGVPEKFTLAFLESMGFKSTNDRPIIAVLKSLNFLDENGSPTQRYKDFKDESRAKKVLGKAIKDAYYEVFLSDEKANESSVETLKGKFATISGKSESVADKMAQTFRSFCNLADFNDAEEIVHSEEARKIEPVGKKLEVPIGESDRSVSLNYNIQIHLPLTKDADVYDKIFRSLKEHLK